MCPPCGAALGIHWVSTCKVFGTKPGSQKVLERKKTVIVTSTFPLTILSFHSLSLLSLSFLSPLPTLKE